jgi:hypothetical protein
VSKATLTHSVPLKMQRWPTGSSRAVWLRALRKGRDAFPAGRDSLLLWSRASRRSVAWNQGKSCAAFFSFSLLLLHCCREVTCQSAAACGGSAAARRAAVRQ